LWLLVGVAFAPALSNGFVLYDDDVYVTANPVVQRGLSWEGLKWAMTSAHVSSNWHPLTWLSHMGDCQMYELRPAGHHLTSVLVHGLNAALLFLVLRLATGAAGRSWLVAALFAAHPLRVESVAWVSERKDVLSVCFGLLAVWAYVRFAQSKASSPKSRAGVAPDARHISRITFHPPRLYLLSLLFFAISLLCKPMLVTLPFALLLLDFWPLARAQLKTQDSRLKALDSLLLEKLPFFALSAASSVVTYLVQQRANVMWTAMPVPVRAANAVVSYGRYVLKIFWPVNLCCFYPHPGNWPIIAVAGAAAAVVVVTAGAWALRRSSPYLLAGWLWFLGTLVPALGLVQVGGQAMADRYTYWPSIGLAVMVIWGLADLVAKTRWSQLAVAVAAVALAACVVLTRRQIGFWQDSEVLFRRAIAVGGEDGRTLTYLGSVLGAMGRPLEAIGYLRQAVVLKPEFPQGHYNLGVALCQAGMVEESLPAFRAALQAQPHYADALRAEAFALHQLGRDQEAVSAYEQSLKLDPESAEAHSSLGALLDRLDRLDEAMKHYREALRINPNSAQTHNNMGAALAKAGKPAEAAGEFAESLRLRPGVASAEINLANALSAAGQGTQAVEHFQAGVQLAPNDAGARYYFGLALAKLGRRGDAVEQFSEALRLQPKFPQAQEQLAALAVPAAK
jgi:tetratricopeptide (TPR) repeat protein